MKLSKVYDRPTKVSKAQDFYELLKGFEDSQREHFIVLGLDTAKRVLFREVVAIGTLNACLVHPREVFRTALRFERGCDSIVVAHNHPSGSSKPSAEDQNLTKRLEECGELLGVKLIDSLIVFKGGVASI